MILHGESAGAGEPVVIVHGLMGSCENWRAVRAALSPFYRVVCLDLPNHGRSPHAARVTLESMAGDVAETLRAGGVAVPYVVVGHSLGGKVAMRLAADRPAEVRGLAVVDMSPRAMQPVHLFVLRACQQLDLAGATRRDALDAALAAFLPQRETRDFLLKNVVRDEAGRPGSYSERVAASIAALSGAAERVGRAAGGIADKNRRLAAESEALKGLAGRARRAAEEMAALMNA